MTKNTTHKWQNATLRRSRRRKSVNGDVPLAQLYRDIERGWVYFLSNRIGMRAKK